nr:hypothetical protein [Bacilli bacterium]
MQITVDQKQFAAALKTGAATVSTRSFEGADKLIRISAFCDNDVYVSSFDGVVGLSVHMSALNTIDVAGSLYVDPKIVKLIAKMSGDIRLQSVIGGLVVSDAAGSYTVAAYEYPSRGPTNGVQVGEINAQALAMVLQNVRYAVATSPLRRALTGIHVRAHAGLLTAQAAQAGAFSQAQAEIDIATNLDMLLPGAAVETLLDHLPSQGTVAVEVVDGYVIFRLAAVTVTVTVRLLDQVGFPDFSLIQDRIQNRKVLATVPKAALQGALTRVGAVLTKTAILPAVGIAVGSEAVRVSADSESVSASVDLPAQDALDLLYSQHFNGDFLGGAISTITGDSVTLEIAGVDDHHLLVIEDEHSINILSALAVMRGL